MTIKTYVSLLFDWNVKQFVKFNTTKSTCHGIVLCNGSISNVKICDTFPTFSDHIPIELDIAVGGQASKKASSRYLSYCRCNFEEMNEDIIGNQFEPDCYSNVDVDTKLWYQWNSVRSKTTRYQTLGSVRSKNASLESNLLPPLAFPESHKRRTSAQ